MRHLLVLAALLAAASPAHAARTYIGFQEIEDFEGALGATTFDFGSPAPDDGILSGGNTIADVPTHSGRLAYSGTSLVFAVANPVDFSWPAVGGWVRGADPITLTVFAYDYIAAMEVEYWSLTIDTGAAYAPLFIGDEWNPQFITRAVFSSDSALLLDDFTLGLPSVIPGIPEPASWALLIAGFGTVGGSMRKRRAALSEQVPRISRW